MRKVWLIARTSLLRTARDRKALLMLLAMPLILIGILGIALKNMMGDWNIDPFPVLVVNQDRPARPPVPAGTPADVIQQIPVVHFGKILTEAVLSSDGVKKYLSISAVTDLEQAKREVAEGKAVAVIHVPADFSALILAGKQSTVTVIGDPGKPTEAGIVTQVVRGFTEGVTSGVLASKVLSPQDAQAFLGGLTGELVRDAAPRIQEVASGAKPVSAMQYYAAAMAVMFMVMTALTRAKEIILERQQGILSRILASPTPKATVLAGQVLGNAVVTLTQFLVLMIGTRLLYGVDWGNWLAALILGAAFAMAAAGIGTAAAGLLDDPKAADASVGIVGNIFAMLSGSMFPVYAFSGLLKTVAQVIPNYWALQGFLDQMAGLSLSYVWTPVAILAAIGLATGAVGTWRLASR